MNSYPNEFLAQHVPLMFVAGLTEPGLSTSAPVSPALSPSASGTFSPSQTSGSSAGTPDPPDASPDVSADPNNQDPFAILISRLKAALTYRRKGLVWDPTRGTAFQVILVDKNVRFPQRKVNVPGPLKSDGTPSGPGTPRSPLSPMTPASPLYPDGLIAPIWVRKHVELVPAVFVLFLRLSELPPLASPLEGRDESSKEKERQRDAELAAEIGARKKITSERGIKLTVVLLASRRMLDDPGLDTRLSFIRRQSGLDSRAALFVLSPVSATELNDFVKSLQAALHEPAMEYYAQHSKRVRRKRNRHSHQNQASISGMPAPPTATHAPRPLRSVGWSVRYEYKLALFAEFRMEEEVARKHYEDCWQFLVEMFGSTAVLPPRTKRWAEAKVLADCIAIKLSKLYLYHNEPHLALAVFNRHVQKFSELSRGWGIGEETFEFWSWIARSYRILGELLEMALRAGYKLPLPTIPSNIARPVAPTTASPATPPVISGLNPSNVLQHPGYYYYMAANCTLQRYHRYHTILEQETSQPGSLSQSPGFINERKVEHHAIIVELLTKAYELFKRFRSGQSRQTFYIACRIAETYHTSGKYDAAIRFFERIARTYRREHWGSMLRTVLLMWYDCARHLGEVELTVKLLLQLLAPGVALSAQERATYEGDLEGILNNSTPPNPEQPIIIDLHETDPILDIVPMFWRGDVTVGDSAPFQISVSAPTDISLANVTFGSLRIEIGGERGLDFIIDHLEAADTPLTDFISLGDVVWRGKPEPVHATADLRWQKGGTKVLNGTIVSDLPRELKVTAVTLVLKQGQWTIELPISFSSNEHTTPQPKPKQWLASVNPVKFVPLTRPNCSVCSVRPRPHQVEVQVDHPEPAYLDEMYPLSIRVRNTDDRELDTVVDVLLHPAEDDSTNRVVFESEESTALIKGVAFGVISAGSEATKTMFLFGSGSPGNRILDISIRTKLPHTEEKIADQAEETPSDNNKEDEATSKTESFEILRTITVPVVRPFATTASTSYQRSSGALRHILDLGLYDRAEFDPKTRATMSVDITNAERWEVEVQEVQWISEEALQRARLVDSSLTMDAAHGSFPFNLSHGDQYSVINQFDIDPLDELGENAPFPIPCPGKMKVTWRRHGCEGWSNTEISCPGFSPPEDNVIGLLHVPPSAALHRPFLATLTVQNRNPTRVADLVLQTETTDAFIVAGPRTCRLPTLFPGMSYDVKFNVVPLLCGNKKLPNFKIYDRRKEPATGTKADETVTLDPLEIVDDRWDERDSSGADLSVFVPSTQDPKRMESMGKSGISLLVLPTTTQ